MTALVFATILLIWHHISVTSMLWLHQHYDHGTAVMIVASVFEYNIDVMITSLVLWSHQCYDHGISLWSRLRCYDYNIGVMATTLVLSSHQCCDDIGIVITTLVLWSHQFYYHDIDLVITAVLWRHLCYNHDVVVMITNSVLWSLHHRVLWSWSRSGELRTQKLKSHLVKTQSFNVLPLKPGIGQCIAIHATLTARDFFLAYFYPSGPFTCIFPETSRFLLCWLWLTHGSCVGLQNKIGHPAGGRFPCWMPAVYK